jgi:hypothetical protein
MAILADNTIPSRRGFLSSLVSLPFVGGGLKLFGAPAAAAVPISADLLRQYMLFLRRESQAARIEFDLVSYPYHFENMGYSLTDAGTWRNAPWWEELPACPAVETVILASPASSRAALVMAAAGLQVTAP